MAGPGNLNGPDRKMTIDGMLNDVNGAPKNNAVARSNDSNSADPNAGGNMTLDNMHRDNVSESSGTEDYDDRISNAQNHAALIGSIYKANGEVDVDGMIWTPDSPEPSDPSSDPSPSSSSFNTSTTSTRSAVPSKSPIPTLDDVYVQAIKNLKRVPSGSIVGLLDQIQALLADRGVGRSELEGEWLTSTFPIFSAST